MFSQKSVFFSQILIWENLKLKNNIEMQYFWQKAVELKGSIYIVV